MSTIQDRPVSQRWIQHTTGQSVKDGYNTGPASQSKMDTTQDRPVSQRWIQHKTSWSVKDGYNTGPASQSKMDTIQTGQSVHDGYNTVWPVGQRWVQQIDRPVGLGPVTSRF